jgi:phosphoribosylanthranilate isomerase
LNKDYGSLIEDVRTRAVLLDKIIAGVTFETFENNIQLVLAVERLFTIIGEAAYKTPRLERGQFFDVPWQRITGLHHRLVHSYGEIRHDRLYEFATVDIPKLIAQLDFNRPLSSDFPFPIKVCGLSTPETMTAALDAGADMVGLVFHRKSPRSVSLELAGELAAQARGRAIVVALTVNPSDEGIDAMLEKVNPDLFQLHGSETPERCAEISGRIERPVMKAIGVAEVVDLGSIKPYRPHIDRVLLDAKPPKDAAYPGGHGKTFDWTVLASLDPFMPFMLSGGLTPDTVGDAIRTVKSLGITLAGVDVSSGIESAPGVKDSSKIKAFVENARTASLETSQ